MAGAVVGHCEIQLEEEREEWAEAECEVARAGKGGLDSTPGCYLLRSFLFSSEDLGWDASEAANGVVN